MTGEGHGFKTFWNCLMCADGRTFANRSSLSDHIEQEHTTHISKEQIPTVLDSSEQAIPAVSFSCPLCPENEGVSEAARFSLDHIAEHVHSFALLSLPWAPDASEVESKTFEEASRIALLWLGHDDPAIPNFSNHSPLTNSTLDEASLYFEKEEYFAEDQSMHSNSNPASTNTEQDLDGFEAAGPLTFTQDPSDMQSRIRGTLEAVLGIEDILPVYSAIYSDVLVFETVVNGVIVMRRQADSWLNVNQILAAAGVDASNRKTILSKQMASGSFESVQKGDLAYRGLWVPLPRGQDLCRELGLDAFEIHHFFWIRTQFMLLQE